MRTTHTFQCKTVHSVHALGYPASLVLTEAAGVGQDPAQAAAVCRAELMGTQPGLTQQVVFLLYGLPMLLTVLSTF